MQPIKQGGRAADAGRGCWAAGRRRRGDAAARLGSITGLVLALAT